LDKRNLIQRFSLSTQNLRCCKLGRKRRLVLLLAWETWWPNMGFLPVTSHTRDMTTHSRILKKAHYILIPCQGWYYYLVVITCRKGIHANNLMFNMNSKWQNLNHNS